MLMAMRAGRKQELQAGSSASAGIWSTSPPRRQATGPQLPPLTRATARPACASTSSGTALLSTSVLLARKGPKDIQIHYVIHYKMGLSYLSQLKSWVGPTNSPFPPAQALSRLLHEIILFHLVPITMYNIKLQHKRKST